MDHTYLQSYNECFLQISTRFTTNQYFQKIKIYYHKQLFYVIKLAHSLSLFKVNLCIYHDR